MDLSGVKLVVTDMDGTLLNAKGELNEEFPEIFHQLRKNNIRFAVASGRQYFSLVKKFRPVLDDLIFIAENGAIVMEKSQERFSVPMKRDKAMEIIEVVKNLGEKYLILCGKKAAYIEETSPEFMNPFLQHYDKYEVVDDLTRIEDDEILKVTICDLAGAEKHSLPHVKHFESDLQVKLSGEIWIDFTDKQAQKGNALSRVQEHYGISPQETMVFGDYFNDVEMFSQAAYSFAMENAHEQVKPHAKYQTASNEEGGVEQVLKRLLQSVETRN